MYNHPEEILETIEENMNKEYVIPVFVPHLGCPNDCIFCNQKSIFLWD